MKKIIQKNKFVLFVSFAIIFGILLWGLVSSRKLQKIETYLLDWKDLNAVYKDGKYFINETVKDKGSSVRFLLGPQLSLKRGSYSVSIDYDAEESQEVLASSSYQNELNYLDALPGVLDRRSDNIIYHFEVKEDISQFLLNFTYSGEGDFSVGSIRISANNRMQKRICVSVIAVVLFLDFLILLYQYNGQKFKTFLTLFGIVVLLSAPMAVKGINQGHDFIYHCLRIESLVDALQSGQFPARVSTLALYGLGYPFSIYYNDIFLYFPAILRLLGFTLIAANKWYVFFINLLTVFLSYYAFSLMFHSRKTGILLSLIYAAASYRFINVYVRSAVGEFTAMAFLPLFSLAIYRIYDEEKKTIKELFPDSVILALSLSGIIGSHNLTFVMTIFMLVLICLFFLRKTFRKQTILTYVIAAFLTIMLNLYYLTPMLDYMINIPTAMGEGADNTISVFIQDRGIYPGMLLGFLTRARGAGTADGDSRMQMTPGLPLMAVLVVGLSLFGRNKKNQWYRFGLFFSLFSLWISTDIFPWNYLGIHVPFWEYLARVQFPWRFLTFAILFMTVFAGVVISDLKSKTFNTVLASAGIFMLLWMTGSYFDNNSMAFVSDTYNLDRSMIDTHFYLPGNSIGTFESDLVENYDENIEAKAVLKRKSDSLSVYCKAGSNPGRHYFSVPVYNYKQYCVVDDNGNEYPVINGKQNLVSFELPDNFDGNVTVYFRDPVYWTISLYVSVFFALFLCCGLFIYWKRSRRFSESGNQDIN